MKDLFLTTKPLKRYRERPSIWHVIVTCFGLLYLWFFISVWLSSLNNPALRSATYFWPTWIALGLGLAGIASFLIRELIRQFWLFRQWISK